MNRYQHATIFTFYRPDSPGLVYIQGTIQKGINRTLHTLDAKRVNYLNRLQLDESKRLPRLDGLAEILKDEYYQYESKPFSCASQKELYREVERMFSVQSAEQIARNRASRRECYARNKEKEATRQILFRKTHRDKINAQKRYAYHHGTRCKEYKQTSPDTLPSFGVKTGACVVTFD
jgi:ribosomal protein L7/L12